MIHDVKETARGSLHRASPLLRFVQSPRNLRALQFPTRQQIGSFNHHAITALPEEKEIARACPSCARPWPGDKKTPSPLWSFCTLDGISTQQGRPALRFPQPVGTGMVRGLACACCLLLATSTGDRELAQGRGNRRDLLLFAGSARVWGVAP
jgi:hypothetical protein